MNDPITAAILGKNLPMLSQVVIDTAMAEVKATVMAAYPELFQQEQQGAPAGQPEGINPNGGGAAQIGAGNEAMGGIGAQPVSQPGTGATAASPEGALGQVTQNMGG